MLICVVCAELLARRPQDDTAERWPITPYLADIDALSDRDRVSVEWLHEVQTGVHVFEGRANTEIARMIARFHEWRVLGDKLFAPDGMVIARNLESAAVAMAALGWFSIDGSVIFWRRFCDGEAPTTCCYPNAFAVRRWLTEHRGQDRDG
ncbi:hypothetical protein [Nocardia colli]|uniref:hypothetical protein n=1 Tax=Nocardia colli TaxID=2545717 RepID=UPI0035D92781